MTPTQLRERRRDRDWSAGREQRRQMIAKMREQADERDRQARVSKAAFEEQQRLIDQAMFMANQAFVGSVMCAFSGIM